MAIALRLAREGMKVVSNRIPLLRFGLSAEGAALVAFPASPEAS